MQKIKLAFDFFIRSLQKYGVVNGVVLFVQLITQKTSSIKLPGIKHPVSLRPNTSDRFTFYQVFLKGEYNLTLPGSPKVVIDGGANVGLFSIQMKNKFPEATFICIEPDPGNFETLKKNLEAYDSVFFENSGLWHKDTKLKVYDKYNAGKWGMVVEEDLDGGTIPALSITTLLEKYNIACVDILKLDIETSEKYLFSTNYEAWLPKVKTIIIELHDWMEPGCSKPFFEAINKSFTDYTFSVSGENIMITNNSIA